MDVVSHFHHVTTDQEKVKVLEDREKRRIWGDSENNLCLLHEGNSSYIVRKGLFQKKQSLVVCALSKMQEQIDFQRSENATYLKVQKEMLFSTARNYILEHTTTKCCCIKVVKIQKNYYFFVMNTKDPILLHLLEWNCVEPTICVWILENATGAKLFFFFLNA